MQVLHNLYKYILLSCFSFGILLIVSIVGIGWNLSLGKVSTKEIVIYSSEIKIVGKTNSPSIRIFGGNKVIHADCDIGVGNLCRDYHGETLYVGDLKLININEKNNIIIYGKFKSKKGNFIIDNIRYSSLLIENSVNHMRIYTKFFLISFIITFLFLFIIKITIKILQNYYKI